jgi:hypothetical protein
MCGCGDAAITVRRDACLLVGFGLLDTSMRNIDPSTSEGLYGFSWNLKARSRHKTHSRHLLTTLGKIPSKNLLTGSPIKAKATT